MWNWIVTMLDRVFAVAGALLFSQVPTFMQQYGQQLTGHVQELKLQLDLMTQTALKSGKTLDQYIHKFLQFSDHDVSNQGQLMQDMVIRYQTLSEASLALNHASAFSKPFVFLNHFYPEIASSTLSFFTPSLSFTLEGGAYVLIGILFGYSIFFFLKKFSLKLLTLRKKEDIKK